MLAEKIKLQKSTNIDHLYIYTSKLLMSELGRQRLANKSQMVNFESIFL